MLDLDSDALLTTTRAVRKRLDFEKPVPRALIEECLQIAFQAPNGGNMNSWRWIVLDDRDLIAKAAEIYNGGLDDYIESFDASGYPGAAVPRSRQDRFLRLASPREFSSLSGGPLAALHGANGERERHDAGEHVGLDHSIGLEFYVGAACARPRERLDDGAPLPRKRHGRAAQYS